MNYYIKTITGTEKEFGKICKSVNKRFKGKVQFIKYRKNVKFYVIALNMREKYSMLYSMNNFEKSFKRYNSLLPKYREIKILTRNKLYKLILKL